MKLTRFVPVLLLAFVIAACGRDSVILPDSAAPSARALDLIPIPESGDDEDPGAPHYSGDPACEGEWVTLTGPDGTKTLVCLSPHTGSGD
jgi:hypothetical protein